MEQIKLKSFLNQRVLVKIRGQLARETTVIALDADGYWTCDGVSPVEFFDSRNVQWIVMADSPSITPEMRTQR